MIIWMSECVRGKKYTSFLFVFLGGGGQVLIKKKKKSNTDTGQTITTQGSECFESGQVPTAPSFPGLGSVLHVSLPPAFSL